MKSFSRFHMCLSNTRGRDLVGSNTAYMQRKTFLVLMQKYYHSWIKTFVYDLSLWDIQLAIFP